MIIFKTNGKEEFVLSDPMFRVNVMKWGKWCIFGAFCLVKYIYEIVQANTSSL